MSEQSGNPQETTVRVTTKPIDGEDKRDKDDMGTSSLGMMAVVIFVFLLLLFLAGVAASGELATPTTTTVTAVGGSTVVAPAAVPQVAAPGNTISAASTTSATGTTTYTVQAGDWLAAIARRYNTTVPAILAANPQITDSNTIQPGVTIVLP